MPIYGPTGVEARQQSLAGMRQGLGQLQEGTDAIRQAGQFNKNLGEQKRQFNVNTIGQNINAAIQATGGNIPLAASTQSEMFLKYYTDILGDEELAMTMLNDTANGYVDPTQMQQTAMYMYDKGYIDIYQDEDSNYRISRQGNPIADIVSFTPEDVDAIEQNSKRGIAGITRTEQVAAPETVMRRTDVAGDTAPGYSQPYAVELGKLVNRVQGTAEGLNNGPIERNAEREITRTDPIAKAIEQEFGFNFIEKLGLYKDNPEALAEDEDFKRVYTDLEISPAQLEQTLQSIVHWTARDQLPEGQAASYIETPFSSNLITQSQVDQPTTDIDERSVEEKTLEQNAKLYPNPKVESKSTVSFARAAQALSKPFDQRTAKDNREVQSVVWTEIIAPMTKAANKKQLPTLKSMVDKDNAFGIDLSVYEDYLNIAAKEGGGSVNALRALNTLTPTELKNREMANAEANTDIARGNLNARLDEIGLTKEGMDDTMERFVQDVRIKDEQLSQGWASLSLQEQSLMVEDMYKSSIARLNAAQAGLLEGELTGENGQPLGPEAIVDLKTAFDAAEKIYDDEIASLDAATESAEEYDAALKAALANKNSALSVSMRARAEVAARIFGGEVQTYENSFKFNSAQRRYLKKITPGAEGLRNEQTATTYGVGALGSAAAIPSIGVAPPTIGGNNSTNNPYGTSDNFLKDF